MPVAKPTGDFQGMVTVRRLGARPQCGMDSTTTNYGASMLARAQGLAGGVEALARQLRVPKKQLGSWIAGEVETPHGVFLRVVDFLRSK